MSTVDHRTWPRPPSLSVVNDRPTTVACLLHSVTLYVPWPNLLYVQSLGQSFKGYYPYFVDTPFFLKLSER